MSKSSEDVTVRDGGNPGKPSTPRLQLPPDYEILGILGEGGMGTVLRARQRSLGREVAIKVVPAALAATQPGLQDMLLAEARVIASLRHPNIVQVYLTGPIVGGGVFVAMELVDGVTLQADIEANGCYRGDSRGHRTLAKALRIIFDLCAALEAAHAAGIVHRDIKPGNIILDSDGRARLMDFGIAMLRADSGDPTIAGTPAYMAPEQAIGSEQDHRADLFAIGGVLFHMLTASAPRAPRTLKELIDTAREKRPLGPDRWALLPATTPPALRSLLERLLAPDPSARFSSAQDLRRALEPIFLTTTAPEASRRHASHRRRTFLIAAGIVALIACASAAYLYLGASKQVASIARGNAEMSTELDQAVSELRQRIARPDLAPIERSLCQNWLTEIEGLRRQGKSADATAVARTARAHLNRDEVLALAQTIRALAARPGLPPALKDRATQYIDHVAKHDSEGEVSEWGTLRQPGLALLGELSAGSR